MRTHIRRAGAAAIAAALLGLPLWLANTAAATGADPSSSCVTETPDAGAPAVYQPVGVCASFDKAAYQSSDVVKLTISVTNQGTAPAVDVWMSDPSFNGSGFRPLGLTGLFLPPAGRDIPAGATVTFEQDGYAPDPDSGTVAYRGSLFQNGGNGSTFGDPVTVTASVTAVHATFQATVFDDTNGNGTQDPGEPGRAGATVTLTGPFQGLIGTTGPGTFQGTTDAQGDVRIDGVPGGQYSVQVTGLPAADIAVVPNELTVDGTQAPSSFPVHEQLSDTLGAQMSFDQPSYHVGEAAHLTVTLTNKGTTTISNIRAGCNHAGDGAAVTGIGEGWQVLAADGPGITLAAGQTRTLHLTELVMVGADRVPGGMFTAECTFGPDQENFEGDPDPVADVPALPATGPTVNPTLTMIDDDPAAGEAFIFGMLLLDPTTGDPMADVTAGGPAHPGRIDGLPTGTYHLDTDTLVGWQPAAGQTDVLDTADLTNGGWTVHVVPRGSQPPPPPTSTTSSTPAPTGTTTAAPATTSTTTSAGGNPTVDTSGGQSLPFTGVDVLAYVVPALALIAAGTLFVLITRRRGATR